MICQVSLFSRFLLLLNIPQTKPSSVTSTRLFFRLGKDQKSPSVLPVDFSEVGNTEVESIESTEIEIPEDKLESESIADSGNDTETSDDLAASPEESLDLLGSGDLTEVNGTEVEWDPLDKESLDDLPTTENIIATQKVLDGQEESANVVATGVDGADGEGGTNGVDAVANSESVAEDVPAVEDVKDVEDVIIENVEEVAIAEDQVPDDLEDLADETLDTSEDQQDVGETDEESDPVAEVEAVADDIEEVADGESEESEQEELEIIGDNLDTEPNLLSQVESGFYTVDATGKVEFTFVFDSGAYEGQLAAISMTGMENLDLNSPEFFRESLQRALSGSEAKLGYIVIDDISAGAMFGGELETGFDYNYGEFAGTSIVEFRAGDKFFLMLIPNGSVAEVEEALEAGTTKDVRPLFSLVAANPTKAIQMGQIVDVTGDGNTYVFEDIRQDGASDKDFNDLIFQVKGATITTVTLDELILEGEMSPEADWRNTEIGQQIVDYAASQVVIAPEPNPVEKYDFPKEDQPLIGFIDTHFTQGNPDIDYSRIILGKDYIQNDSDPTVVAVAGEGTHGDHILGIVAATQDNGVGIEGINDDAPLWVSSAVESGKWADALVEFVDAAIASNQPNAIINLSIDLTQVNPDGSVTTRYEFTPQERTAIEYARQNGVLIVAAAGNDGGVMSVLGQASQEFDNIITVGSSDGLTRAEYSSYGKGLGILAPGGTASDPELSLTGEGVGLMSGTSVATAKVTGAVSQVWAANPELSYRQVIEILKSTATDLSTPGWDAETGAGLLNMVAAVSLAKISVGEEYKPVPLFAPDSWSGEGKVTPTESPVAGLNINTPAPKPGENKVPLSAGSLINTVKSQTGVVTYYYQNGFLTMQPNGVSSWTTTLLPSTVNTRNSGLATPTLLSPASSLNFATPLFANELAWRATGNIQQYSKKSGTLNSSKPEHTYYVDVKNKGYLQWEIKNLAGKVRVQVIHDANSNGVIDASELSSTTVTSIGGTSRRALTLDKKGRYFIKLFTQPGQQGTYEINAIGSPARPQHHGIDFNGDVQADIVRQEKGSAAYDNIRTVEAFTYNEYSGSTFQKFSDLASNLGGNHVNLVWGDFNGDGRPDYIRQEKGDWANNDNNDTATLWLADSTGKKFWQERDLSSLTGSTFNGNLVNIIPGDFNGDGRTDFIRQEKGEWDNDSLYTAEVWMNTGAVNFTMIHRLDFGGDNFKGDLTNLIPGDFDGDGRTDFIRQEKGEWDDDKNNTAEVYLSNGNGQFRLGTRLKGLDDDFKGDLTNLIPGDFNGDGRTDFIRQEKGEWDDDEIRTAEVWLSNGGTGEFTRVSTPLRHEGDDFKGNFVNIVSGDFNGDGLTDIIRQEYGPHSLDQIRTAEVFLATGNGTFSKYPRIIRYDGDDFKGNVTNILTGVPTTSSPFYESVDSAKDWVAEFHNFPDGQNKPNDLGNDRSGFLGVGNLGSKIRSDGKRGLKFDLGDMSPDSRISNDNFAIRAYTQYDFDANKTYVANIRSDDGYRLFAKNVTTGEWVDFTPNGFREDAYGASKQIEFKVPKSGTYDFHFEFYDRASTAYFDLAIDESSSSGGGNSSGGNTGSLLSSVSADYFLARPQFYTTGNPFFPYYAPMSVGGTGGLSANCTWYASGRVKEMGGNAAALASMLGNANQWHNQLSNGATISGTPQVGDIAQWSAKGENHVAVVEKVNPNGSIVISESNYAGMLHHTRTIAVGAVGSQATGWPDRFIRVPSTSTGGGSSGGGGSSTGNNFETAKQAAIQRVGAGNVGSSNGAPFRVNVGNSSGWVQEFFLNGQSPRILMLEDGKDTAYWIHGDNLKEYQRLGDLNTGNPLGFPQNDETRFSTSSSSGVWQAFSGANGKARIHNSWTGGRYNGSVATWGDIGTLYTDLGGASHWLGVPTRAEYTDGDTIFADFEGGQIASKDGKTEALKLGEKPSWLQLNEVLDFIRKIERENSNKSTYEIANILRGYTRDNYRDNLLWTLLTGSSNPVNLGDQLNNNLKLNGQITDFGHLIASLSDQILSPFVIQQDGTGDLTSWAGDIGSAVVSYQKRESTSMKEALNKFCSDSDYSADIAACVIGEIINGEIINSNGGKGSIADAILKYSQSSYSDNIKTFISKILGGTIEGNTLKNPADVEANIRNSVAKFVNLWELSTGTLPTGTNGDDTYQGSLHFLNYLVRHANLDSFKFKPYKNSLLTILGVVDWEESLPI